MSPSFEQLLQRGSIRDCDVEQMRSALAGLPALTPAEASALVQLNHVCPVQDMSWTAFYVATLCDFLVVDSEPAGYLTSANGAWIADQIAADGVIRSRTDLALLTTLIERARWSPESLVRLTLSQVKHAVTTGQGPLRLNMPPMPGHLLPGDVDLIRRVLAAFAKEEAIGITGSEIDALLAIDACVRAPAPAGWSDLLVRAIITAALDLSGYMVPTRSEALAESRWIAGDDDASATPARRALAQALQLRAFDELIDQHRPLLREERAMARLHRQRIEIITNEAVTGGDPTWLAQRLTESMATCPAIPIALDVLRASGRALDPALNAAMVHAQRAA